MSTTYPEAVDQMYGRIKTQIDTNALPIVGIVPEVRYLGRAKPDIPPPDKMYLEVNVITNTSRQSGFGVTKRLYTTTGTLYAKLFAPMATPNNFRLAMLLADMLKKSFEIKELSASVWYRNARIVELIPERGFYRFNLTVDYNYDERR